MYNTNSVRNCEQLDKLQSIQLLTFRMCKTKIWRTNELNNYRHHHHINGLLLLLLCYSLCHCHSPWTSYSQTSMSEQSMLASSSLIIVDLVQFPCVFLAAGLFLRPWLLYINYQTNRIVLAYWLIDKKNSIIQIQEKQ